jgi:LysR family transcriptional regulator of beta-lactamase
LRTFELAARLESFARAAEQLNVTPAAVSHQVRQLEAWLGVPLFDRRGRGLRLSARGRSLQPIVAQGIARLVDGVTAAREHGRRNVVLGAVSTLALGWLAERLKKFRNIHPEIRVQLRTNNNRRVNLAADGLDLAIRYGSGRWAGCESTLLRQSNVTPLCSRRTSLGLSTPEDLSAWALLSSYHSEEWESWARRVGLTGSLLADAFFESSVVMVQAALMDIGIALADPDLFRRELVAGELVQPFAETVRVGGYWLTWRQETIEPAAAILRDWLIAEAACD